MEMTNKNKIILGVAAVLILLALYFVFDGKSKTSEVVENTEPVATSTGNITEYNVDGVTYQVEKLDPASSIPKPIPDLNRVLVKSPKATAVTESDIASASKKIKELQDFLKDNPSVFPAWLDLGAYQKSAGDYDGAIISWEYASKLFVTDSVSLGNIGSLYGYHINDMAMSELYYKKAISRAPGQSYLYAQLSEVYLYIGKSEAKAKAILNEGLKAIPNDPNLTYLLSELDK